MKTKQLEDMQICKCADEMQSRTLGTKSFIHSRYIGLLICKFLFICIFAHLQIRTFANNVIIQNVLYTPPNITFQISWENNWYTTSAPNNWDAVWLFVKYQVCGSGVPASPQWVHADLSSTLADHSITCAGTCAPINLQIEMPAVADNRGVFIRGNALAAGFTGLWNVSLRMKAAGSAITACPAAASCNWKVFAIEMVWVPTIAFSTGDGSGTTTNPFNDNLGTPGNPYTVAGAGAIVADALYAGSPALGASYPKGYNGFYCMKHEISQEEYYCFLNTINYDQQKTRVKMSPDSINDLWAITASPNGGPYNRQAIRMIQRGIYNYVPARYGLDLNNDLAYNGVLDGTHIACNYLRWQDVCAFLDWAALRPMTELEYEKVCRGVNAAVADEYPWGTATDLTSGTSTMLANAGRVSEIIDTAIACTQFPTTWCPGLAIYNGVAGQGPVRVGQAARNTTTRVQAGGAYYGAMDMAGNVWEQVVSVNAAGAAFQGTLGDGALTTTAGYEGNATNADWPGIDATPARGVTGASGSGARGGSWATTNISYLRTSDRTNATTPMTGRDPEYGGRGVR